MVIFKSLCFDLCILWIGSCKEKLQVKTFWNISLLTVESLFFRFLKIFLGYFHSAFSQSKHTSFRTNGLDIGTTELIPTLNEFFQIHLKWQNRDFHHTTRKTEKVRYENRALMYHSSMAGTFRMAARLHLKNLHLLPMSFCWYEC